MCTVHHTSEGGRKVEGRLGDRMREGGRGRRKSEEEEEQREGWREGGYDLFVVYPLLPQAFHMEMYHPGYVWITPGWYGEGWWMVGGEESLNCTLQQLETVLNRSLTVTVEAQNSGSISGKVSDLVDHF